MRKLLAMVIAASVCAPVFVCSPVMGATKVYGELHVSFDKFEVDSSTSTDTDAIALNSSLLGIKGLYNLKKDLNVIYQFEVGFQSDRGNDLAVGSKQSGIENRHQVIGLAGKYGAFIVGRYDTPFKTLGRKADLFWHTQLGQNRNLTNPARWDQRADSIMIYQTPRLNNFQGTVAFAKDINVLGDSSAISVNGFYKLGLFKLGAAYEKQDLSDINAKPDAVRLMARYNEGPLTLLGFFQQENNETIQTGIADATVFGVGVAYRLGQGKLKGQFYSRDISNTSNDPDLFAVGYDYRIAKTTEVYAQFAKVTKGQRLGGADHGVAVSSSSAADAEGVSFGIRYKF